MVLTPGGEGPLIQTRERQADTKIFFLGTAGPEFVDPRSATACNGRGQRRKWETGR